MLPWVLFIATSVLAYLITLKWAKARSAAVSAKEREEVMAEEFVRIYKEVRSLQSWICKRGVDPDIRSGMRSRVDSITRDEKVTA